MTDENDSDGVVGRTDSELTQAHERLADAEARAGNIATNGWTEARRTAEAYGRLADENAALRGVAEAAKPFRAGEWGGWLAWLTTGAPDRETGIRAAKWIVERQKALDAAFGALDQSGPPATQSTSDAVAEDR